MEGTEVQKLDDEAGGRTEKAMEYGQKGFSLGTGGLQQGGKDGTVQRKVKKEESIAHIWSLVPVIPALRRFEFEAGLRIDWDSVSEKKKEREKQQQTKTPEYNDL